MKVFVYWLARTALWGGVLLALWALGMRHWTAVVLAAVIAWLISYLAFGSLHDAAAKQMEQYLVRRSRRQRADEDDEDAELGSA